MSEKGSIFSIEEIISMQKMGEPVINKDGSLVAYEISSADWHTNKYLKELWIYNVLTKKQEQIISKKESYQSPAKWSPDGRYLAVLLQLGDQEANSNQIYVIDANTREKRQVSAHQNSIVDFIWSADSKAFYYLAEADKAERIKDRDEKYGKFSYIDQEKTNNCLYYLALKKGLAFHQARYELPQDCIKKSKKAKNNKYYPAVLLSAEKKFYIRKMKASADGRKLALTVAPSPSMEDYQNLSLSLYDIKTGEFEEVKIENFDGNVLFSPDSSKVLFSRLTSWLKNNEIATYHLKTKKIKKMKIAIDEKLYASHWLKQGVVLYYQDKTEIKYVLFDKDNNLVPILSKKNTWYSGFDCTADGQHRVYLERGSDGLEELWVDEHKVTNYSSLLKEKRYANKQMISWTNADGVQIEGVLSRLKDFDANKKYPLLVIIHGGPQSTSVPYIVNDSLYPIETFVESGFITLEPNYRGSGGYGEQFRSANFRNLGLGDYQDVISGVDHLIDLAFVDKEKVGVMGWSQGGFITAFCATFSRRFKAASIGAGISDWTTYYYNTDIPKFTKEYLDNVPFKDKSIYEKTSPINYINQAQTPTLIQHGSVDQRVPIANAYELYRALKELELNPKMVIYEDMGHLPSTPAFKRAINRENLYWFRHHLLDEELDEL